MKVTLASVLIFVCIITLSYFTRAYTEKISDKLTESIEQCKEHVDMNNWKGAESSAKKAREIFAKNSHTLESYLLHEDIERLSDILTNIEIAVKTKDKTASLSNIEIFKRRLLELVESDTITLNNIL